MGLKQPRSIPDPIQVSTGRCGVDAQFDNDKTESRKRKPKIHACKRWGEVTDAIVRAVNAKKEKVVFTLWGRDAKRKSRYVTGRSTRSSPRAVLIRGADHAAQLQLRSRANPDHDAVVTTSFGQSSAGHIANDFAGRPILRMAAGVERRQSRREPSEGLSGRSCTSGGMLLDFEVPSFAKCGFPIEIA
ncbi:hypothetical protein [Sphingomonas sp. R86521]|uniref:hypothetical protein n=1 Tax=Sphingomonas sp. R86521 TaxID=3093860 RepID=UPI0036D31975